MSARRVAPSSIVASLIVVRRTKVGCSNEDGRMAGLAPLLVIDALDFEASTARLSIVEQSRAQCRCLIAIAFAN